MKKGTIFHRIWLKFLLIWVRVILFQYYGIKKADKTRTLLFLCCPFLYPLLNRMFWNRVSQSYAKKVNNRHVIARCITNNILEHFDWDSLLEVGCGTGDNLAFLKQMFPDKQFAGCDFSSNQIEQAKQFDGVQFDVADCRHLPYADNSFDVVITVGCLAHIPSTHIRQCAKELQRVARYSLLIFEEDYNFTEPTILLTQQLLGWHFYHNYRKLFNEFDVQFIGNNMRGEKIGLHTHVYTRRMPALI